MMPKKKTEQSIAQQKLANRQATQFLPIILWRALLKKVFIWTIGGTLFLSLVVSLAELFSLLWKFLAQNALFWDIVFWIGLGITNHMVDTLPVAFLFAIVFVLGDWHANHELEAVFSAGISLQRLLIPILAISMILCAAEFCFTNYVSIPFQEPETICSRGCSKSPQANKRFLDLSLMEENKSILIDILMKKSSSI